MKNFNLRIILRIVLLSVTMFLSFHQYFLHNTRELVALTILIVYQVYSLLRFISHTNNEITDFLRGINYSDFSQHVRIGKLGGSFVELADEMNKLLTRFRDTRSEKEEGLRFTQTIVEHVGIGLLAFDPEGNVHLINKAAKRILKIQHIQNIQALNEKHNGLGHFLLQFNRESRNIFKFQDNGGVIQLVLNCTAFRMRATNLKLFSLYDIQPELEEKEIEAWQKLMRVLTHEIINSITPIASLAGTAAGMLNVGEIGHVGSETLLDIKEALTIIQRRSDGLSSFINKFRDISKLPKPNFQTVAVADLFYRVRLLTGQMFSDSQISLTVSVEPENLEIMADADLMEQVLINLINNSVHALRNIAGGSIGLSAEITDRGRALLKVTDNGEGIAEEVLDKVFIPFFTTKQEGSGIGLSLSQSIIHAHRGNIWVQSQPGSGTVFMIRL